MKSDTGVVECRVQKLDIWPLICRLTLHVHFKTSHLANNERYVTRLKNMVGPLRGALKNDIIQALEYARIFHIISLLE